MNLPLFFIKAVFGLKTKISLLLIFIVILLSALLTVQINISLPYKFSQDLTLMLESFVFHLIPFFTAFSLITNRHLQIFILSNGVSRNRLIVAFVLSICLAIFAIFCIFVVINFIVFSLIQNSMWMSLSIQLFLFALSSIFLALIFILLALNFGYFSALIYSIVIFTSGSSLQTIKSSIDLPPSFDFLFYLYPNFEFFNMLGALTSGANFDFINIALWVIFYFILYSSIIFVFIIKKFNTKIL